MSSQSQNQVEMSAAKQALRKIRELKRQLAAARSGQAEDIAIVSTACRFPRQANTPEAYWRDLLQGADAVGEIPAQRWDVEAYYDEDPDAPGKMYARRGAFLEHLDLMDPDFFGISPREATWVDPQQRLLLEVSWEALERAGWRADKIGEEAGLFVGWMHNDYQNESSDSLLNLNPYIATGSAGSFLCGRLSYYLGLQGPSVAVDTACSSSLVALHLACQSLHRGECSRAIVGGVNAIVSPTTNILTCKLKALSPEGHSRAFDARADGYLRGEGCGVVTLRRLADAQRDGEPILAVIRGSAVGHNGFSSGLTAPNPRAQERVIRDALRRAAVDPARVEYLEAHGTGTELGDPIEMQAAAGVLGDNRDPDKPLLVGSVKTNIGHLEAAAGMAGLIKVLLAFQNDVIPAQLHFEEPNPHIPWDRLPVKVVVEPTAWPGEGPRRIAGVSAFGMSGTNAHVVLESPPVGGPRKAAPAARIEPGTPPAAAAERGGHCLVTLSAKSEEALLEMACRYRDWLADHPEASLADVAYTAGAGRRHFDHRLAMVVESTERLRDLLDQESRTSGSSQVVRGARRSAPKVAWQFTGQGSQYVGMGQGLYQSQPVFRDALDQCDQWMRQWRDRSLLDVCFRERDLIDRTQWTQPALFAQQMGLARLLESWGMRPDAVLGHSVGQYAAACVAGVLSWEDGLRLISERGRLIGQLPSGGVMSAVFAPSDQVATALADHPDVSMAALNGAHTVISGPEKSVAAVAGALAERGVRASRLTTSHAFHSCLMEPALEPFGRAASEMQFRPPQLPLICNVTGQPLEAQKAPSADYWLRHIREPVRYADSLQAVQNLGCDVLLELGPRPVLTRMAQAVWGASATGLISCLQQEQDDLEALLWAAAQLYVHGVTPDFAALDVRPQRSPLLLPTYPFQRRRFWGPARPQDYRAEVHTRHPLLGGRKLLAGLPAETRYEAWVAADQPGWLADHQVMGDTVLPGAAFVEMALAAAPNRDLTDLKFEQPLRPGKRSCLQTIVRNDQQQLDSPQPGRQRQTIQVHSLRDAAGDWTRHFSAAAEPRGQQRPAALDRAAALEACSQSVEPAEFYHMMQGLGLDYGPQFQTIGQLHYGDGGVLARLETTADLRGYTIPPTVLDGAFHSLAIGLMRGGEQSLFLPVAVDRVACFAAVERPLWCHGTWKQAEGEVRSADLTLFDDEGQVLARIENLRLRQLNRAALRQMGGSGPARLLHQLTWRATRLPPLNSAQSHWLVVGPAAGGPTAAGAGRDGQGLIAQRQAAGADGATLQLESGAGPAAAVRDALVQRGQRALCVELVDTMPDQSGVDFADSTPRLTGDQPQHWLQLLDHWRQTQSVDEPQGIVWVVRDEAGGGECGVSSTSMQRNCAGLLALIDALRQRNVQRLRRGLQLVTSHAMAVDQAQPAAADAGHMGSAKADFRQAGYWGLGRVIGAEQPALRCRLIDLPAAAGEPPQDVVQSLVDVLLNDSPENQLAIRDGQIHAPRLTAVRSPSQQAAQFSADPDGCYLITGGLGMLGRQAALWLARRGARHLTLVSRRPPSRPALEVIGDIEQLGCQVHVRQADISARLDVENLLAQFGDTLPALSGVIHAAGVLDDGLLADQSWDRFQTVLAPKAQAAWLLHELTAELPLDFFVLYSSAASVLGSPGQSNYAMANALLDGLAWQRRQCGLPALSVNWGPWTEGMADQEMIVKRLALQGVTPLSAAEAHSALEKLLAAGTAQATVLDVDWRRMRRALGNDSPPLLDEIAPAGTASRTGSSALVEKLRKMQGAARSRLLVNTIQGELQEILAMAQAPDPDTPLIEMGLDSLMAVEFSTRLQQQLGDDFALAPTLLFDYPTVTALADYLLELMTELPEAEPAAAEPAAVHKSSSRDEVVIVGMGCRFPGAADIRQFWDNLQDGVDSVGEIPPDRWDVERYYRAEPAAGKMYTRRGGFLDGIGDFDAEFFNISAAEACWTDPQHRLLLEVSWEALEDAGIRTYPLADSRVGVFVGIMSQDYGELLGANDAEVIDGFQGGGLSHSAGVGRISYTFGFEGPSLAIDSASSSSLVAVCQAAKSLLSGECNLALAGGVNAILTPTNSLLLCKAGMLSADGRCKSFSAAADGFGRGEGCGMVVLKRRRDAERDGDRILAVIRGSAVSHNGFSGGLTSPNGRSQERAIREALDDAGLRPAQIQYLEAHGTGTELGDPIELRAAASVLGKGRPADQPLLVGSVKANIGHLEAAGGISGLIKTVLTMQHGVIPRQLHFDQPSPHVPWDHMPVKVVEQHTHWPEAEQRLAGVTALGLSGTNAHVVLSGPPPDTAPRETVAERPSRLLVLSARREQDLRQLARRYDDWLEENNDASLADLCHTAATGRRHFEHRAALVVESTEEARQRLQALAAARSQPGCHVGQSRSGPQLAWLFSGDSAEWSPGGKSLCDVEPVFREVVEQCDQALLTPRETARGNLPAEASPRDSSVVLLRDWLLRNGSGQDEPPARRPDAGVALFALQMGLARLWQSWGVEADVVLGCGVGQYAAACVSGVLKLEDAVKLLAARGRLPAAEPGVGSADVGGSGHAARNGSSPSAALDAFEALADTVDYLPPDRPLICDLSGQVVPVHRVLGGSHWRRHCEEPPRIAESLRTLAEHSCQLVLELGPRPLLTGDTLAQWPAAPPLSLPSLRPGAAAWDTVLDALAQLYVNGLSVDFEAVDRPWRRKKVGLPTYPFQRRRHWITDLAK